MYTFDPYNPLAGLQNIPGVVDTTTDQSALNSYGNQLGFQNALTELSKGLQQGNNPLLLLGRTGLGYTTGKQQAGMNLLNMSQLRQNLMKGGADLTKSGYEIGEKQFDLNKKMTQQQGLYQLIKNLNPEAKALALSNQDEFTKMMIGNMNLTGSVKEYEYAKNSGYPGTYTDYVRDVEKYRATNISSTLKMPEKDKEILKSRLTWLEARVGEADTARLVANETALINQLLEGQESGGMVKLGAQAKQFLGINDDTASVNAVVEALRTKSAPLIRPTGSGSTSDMEFQAYMSAFPSLMTTPAGRKLMGKIAKLQAERKSKLADWAEQAISGEGDVKFSYAAYAAYDDSLGSVINDEMKQAIEEELKNTGNPKLIDNLKKSKNIVYNKKG